MQGTVQRPGFPARPLGNGSWSVSGNNFLLNQQSGDSVNKAIASICGIFLFVGTCGDAFPQAAKKPAGTPPQSKHAALAIDRGNGFYYGWAHDHPSQVEAERFALKAAAEHGAKNPSIVLSWSGSGCGAYRTVEGNVGTAYGWGVAASQEAAERIASEQALKRSKGKPVPNRVWACNSKSTPLSVIYDASPEIYGVVSIGKQVWASEGLQAVKFRNGDPVRQAKSAEEFQKFGREKIPAFFCYTPQSCATHGKLYNGYAVLDPRGLAPAGWRIPSKGDWETLFGGLGGKSNAGPKLRIPEGWPTWAVAANNSSGFSAMAVNPFMGSIDRWQKETPKRAAFWTSTVLEEGKYLHHALVSAYDSGDEAFVGNQSYSDGVHVRLIKE